MKGAVKLYIIIVLIKAKMTTNGKKKKVPMLVYLDTDDCFLVQRV